LIFFAFFFLGFSEFSSVPPVFTFYLLMKAPLHRSVVCQLAGFSWARCPRALFVVHSVPLFPGIRPFPLASGVSGKVCSGVVWKNLGCCPHLGEMFLSPPLGSQGIFSQGFVRFCLFFNLFSNFCDLFFRFPCVAVLLRFVPPSVGYNFCYNDGRSFGPRVSWLFCIFPPPWSWYPVGDFFLSPKPNVVQFSPFFCCAVVLIFWVVCVPCFFLPPNPPFLFLLSVFFPR